MTGKRRLRVIVTGGSGFIGSHLVRNLRDAGHEVVNIDLNSDGPTRIDVSDTENLVGCFRETRPEFVFHVAGVADARAALANPVEAVRVNVGGTASVFEAARRAGAGRVILASTCWVASAMPEGLLDESAPFMPTGGGHVYTSTKIAAELIAHDFHRLYGLPFTILRYGIPYGPGMWQGLVLRGFLDAAAAGGPITIFGDGSASRKFVYVDDLVRAHVLAMQDVAANQLYNIEGLRFVTIRELAEIFARLWGPVTIAYCDEPSRIGEVQYFRKALSSQKALVELGWQPRVDLEEGVRRTIDWYRTSFGGPPVS
ncbi:MAG: NAD-dependent epimerase/dehydratase family protein [Betaproteobacteria bacterium]